MAFPLTRLRRLRSSSTLRDLVSETHLRIEDFVLPLFIRHDNETRPIGSMPGHFQLSLKDLPREIEAIQQLNLPAVMLFGIPANKDEQGSSAWDSEGIIQQAIRLIKSIAPHLLVMTDLCFCEYTTHTHCGILHHHDVDNDATLEILAKQALSHAKAGADILAPSGMMDGAVQAIRHALDTHHFERVVILSHAVKYASSLYGPFREAAESTLKSGDRKTYQMNPANAKEAIREAMLDIEEGADMLMVKPALSYLDIISSLTSHFPGIPVAAYQVSGEFSMIKAAAEKGWINGEQAMLESLLSIKRAGARFIITYFAKEAASLIKGA